MTDGQQRDQSQGSGEEFVPKPGQPTLPFRAVPQPPPATDPQQPGGYGYPQQQGQQSGYGYPQQPQQPQQQSGYGYPQQHAQQAEPDPHQQESTAPAWAPPSAPIGESSAPDWSALAERSEQDGKRRRLLMFGGGAAIIVIAAIVATAVVVSGGHKKPVAGPTHSPTAVEPTPTFSNVTPPPAPNPLAVLSDPKKDTAPLTAAGLFPAATLNYGSHHYTKGALDSTTSCAAEGGGGLGSVLERHGCHKLLRASYYANGYAVTIGVAVFDSKADADGAKNQAAGYLLPLSGDGLGAFCHATNCQTSANAVGRYAYFTIAGRTDGVAVSASDAPTLRIAGDVADFTFRQIVARGTAEAESGAGS
jgi:hypothetical protein